MPFAERAGVRIHYRDEGSRAPARAAHRRRRETGRCGTAPATPAGSRGSACSCSTTAAAAGAAASRASPVMHGRVRADVVAVADAAGRGRSAFAGYSMGAAVGYRLAAAHRDRVAALVPIGGVADDPGRGGRPGTGSSTMLEDGRHAGALATRSRPRRGSPSRSGCASNFDETDAGQFVLSLRAWAEEGDTTWDDLGRIECPTALDRRLRRGPAGSLERMRRRDPGRGDDRSGSRAGVTWARSSTRRPCSRRAARAQRGSRRGASVDFAR